MSLSTRLVLYICFFVIYMTYLLQIYLIIAHQVEIITVFSVANTSSECLNGLHTVVLDFNY
jgi:hypothetical protein